MGSSNERTPDELRADLRHFARLILRLERDGRLLEATPQLLKLLGDLRSKLFSYEVRATPRARATTSDPLSSESERIVREALERELEARSEWESGFDTSHPDDL